LQRRIDKQGKSVLGIARHAIVRFVKAEGIELIGAHVEVETWQKCRRIGPAPAAAWVAVSGQ
jgi:hypothetical protein